MATRRSGNGSFYWFLANARSGAARQQHVAGAAGGEKHEIVFDPRLGLEAGELGFIDPPDDRQRVVHFLGNARNRILIDRVLITIDRIGHNVTPHELRCSWRGGSSTASEMFPCTSCQVFANYESHRVTVHETGSAFTAISLVAEP